GAVHRRRDPRGRERRADLRHVHGSGGAGQQQPPRDVLCQVRRQPAQGRVLPRAGAAAGGAQPAAGGGAAAALRRAAAVVQHRLLRAHLCARARPAGAGQVGGQPDRRGVPVPALPVVCHAALWDRRARQGPEPKVPRGHGAARGPRLRQLRGGAGHWRAVLAGPAAQQGVCAAHVRRGQRRRRRHVRHAGAHEGHAQGDSRGAGRRAAALHAGRPVLGGAVQLPAAGHGQFGAAQRGLPRVGGALAPGLDQDRRAGAGGVGRGACARGQRRALAQHHGGLAGGAHPGRRDPHGRVVCGAQGRGPRVAALQAGALPDQPREVLGAQGAAHRGAKG
ncbi:hypothetical protein IWW55_007431, partial [Coemansia sp. RSA 2706]